MKLYILHDLSYRKMHLKSRKEIYQNVNRDCLWVAGLEVVYNIYIFLYLSILSKYALIFLLKKKLSRSAKGTWQVVKHKQLLPTLGGVVI